MSSPADVGHDPDVRPGPDGRLRCPWALGSDELLEYHDGEWGQPIHGDVALFERLCLEGFQAGLAWITILRKRQAFRQAFAEFDPVEVAAYTAADVQRLLADPSIVRNRAKIMATIANAQALLDLWADTGVGSLDHLVWSRSPVRPRPVRVVEVPAATAASVALSQDLRSLGFRFVGPITCYATMQACGVVDDHLADCWV